ncbi:restriction endonuclease subunit S [Aliivibrio salmonicida]|uniref:restriction endonuclease subunit S n=1 Tax=Aliivibrio salmonicida TaxID=40269 RepID=UPI003D0C9D87
MGSEWKNCELGDVIELKRGYDLPKIKRINGGIPVISSSGDSGEHNEHKVMAPGVVTGRYGTIGKVFYIEEDFWPLNTTLYVKDFKGNDPLYVYYFLKTISYSDYTDKAAVPGINRNHIHKAKVRVPKCPDHQKEIAIKLYDLDKKITLNRQINQTLEQMAQTLFKSWFVDFDPVIDNALDAIANGQNIEIPESLAKRFEARKTVRESEGFEPLPADIRQLFPCEFEEREPSAGISGFVPKGWEVTCFGMVSECFDRLRVPLSKKNREEKKPGLYPYHGATSVMDYINDYLFDDIYLLIGEDGSVIKDDGTPFIQYIWGKSWVNNHAHVLQGRNGISTEHLLLFMSQTDVKAYVTGAVQLKINQKNMNSINFLKATDDINFKFMEIISYHFQKIRSLKEELDILTKLRDTLLPKLISGELRLDSPQGEALQQAVSAE